MLILSFQLQLFAMIHLLDATVLEQNNHLDRNNSGVTIHVTVLMSPEIVQSPSGLRVF